MEASASQPDLDEFDEPTVSYPDLSRFGGAVAATPAAHGNESISRFASGSTASWTNDRNPGMPLDIGWVLGTEINKPAVDRRAAAFSGRRCVKKAYQAGWLLKAITCTDLTTLAGDDTPGNVQRLCSKARQPIRPDILEAIGCADLPIRTGAVCVYPGRVKDAVAALAGSGIPVASVATGFPSGQIRHEHKLLEIEMAVADGASEIDIVISRDAVLTGDWQRLYDEVADMRQACGEAHMKAIIATGELATLTNVHRASMVCMMAGSDFIKTSTGKEKTNATIPVSLVMVRALREYLQHTGYKVGFKPARGISNAKTALNFMAMMKDELGTEWLQPHLFRIGASSLVTDIERQLSHHATGQYAADYYMPMS